MSGALEAPWLTGLGENVGSNVSSAEEFLSGFERRVTGDIVTLISGKEVPLLAAHLVTKTPITSALPPMDMRLATTRGTNALLTRRGVPPVFFTTRSLGDLLLIGTQQRPDLFALDITRPEPLYASVIEISARMSAKGEVLAPLDEESVRETATNLVQQGQTHAAICLLHADRFPDHELQLAQILRECGFLHVSISSQLAPFMRILPRAQTTLVNAYLSPIIETYKQNVVSGLSPDSTLLFMTSAGGLVAPDKFFPKDSLLSGPAGGVVGARAMGQKAGFSKIIGFDMGGTSTDVCRLEKTGLEETGFEYTFEHTVGDATVFAPAIAVESVAAGGGSLCQQDAMNNLTVGPQSAGAFPGPACYGQGGPLTLTDVNLLLGYLNPAVFEIPLSVSSAQAALAQIIPSPTEQQNALQLWREIANEKMAHAIRTITTRRGIDPAEYALLAFGGAGGQHACDIATTLGIQTVLFPEDAGLLSAYGLGQAALENRAERQVLEPLSTVDFPSIIAQLEAESRMAFANNLELNLSFHTLVRLRVKGQESCLTLSYSEDLFTDFRTAFAALYGYEPKHSELIEVESIRVIATAQLIATTQPVEADLNLPSRDFNPRQQNQENRFATVLIPPHWETLETIAGVQVLKAKNDLATESKINSQELFLHRFTQIATEMGETLQRTALSVNVKERLDFSCALLSPEGDLVATAAHIPVHLGALGVGVRRLREALPAFSIGDVILTNHPAFGGSHLPDLTLVTPVFDLQDKLLGFVASRAHHAEIGGTRPGSMPPHATTLAEEGVVISPVYLLKKGVAQWESIEELFTKSLYPTRNWAENRADLEAMLAANLQGERALQTLAKRYGASTIFRHQLDLADRAEKLAGYAIAALGEKVRHATGQLDDGTPICVTLRPKANGPKSNKLEIDFTGTGHTHPGNLNAPPAVVMACVLYVLRLLIRENLPLNEGLLRAVTLILPPNTLVNPDFQSDPAQCPAVVGGNTEVSQRIVTLLLRALEICADSQTTMNNILFGNAEFGYYETIGGGAGATPSANGVSAVHTHMTNTRLTDPELLEVRYPVRVEKFSRRANSGGAGKHQGGDGILRELTFLAPVSLSVLTQNRTQSPQGLHGGAAGKPGEQTILRTDGTKISLHSIDAYECEIGDKLILATPGGGGYGD